MLIPQCPYCKALLPDLGPVNLCPECGRNPANAPGDIHLPAYPSFSMAPGKSRPRREDGTTAAAGAAAGAAGFGIGVIVLAVGGVVACCICMVATPVFFLFWAGGKAVEKAVDVAKFEQSKNNLKDIGLACHSFEFNHKHLPSPRMQPQAPGNPAPDLSWRVSILPHIQHGHVFDQFDKTQGWNQGRNNALLSPMPRTYRAGEDPLNTTTTKFQYFTGPDTIFPDPLTKKTLLQITDGSTSTLLACEAKTPVTWSKVEDMTLAPGALPLPQGRFVAVMCDGAVRVINRDKANDETLRMLINPTDGRVLPGDWDQ
jgi:hypothetical protein